MRNKIGLVFGIILGFWFVLVGCDNGNSPGNSVPQSVTYISSDGQNSYILEITENFNRARYVVKPGDCYSLKIECPGGDIKISTGVVQSIDNDGLNLKPSNANDIFKIDVSSGKMISITGKITFEDNSNITISNK
jgi:hypothetical protein